MALTAETWPIAASLLNFPPADPAADTWYEQAVTVLTEVAEAGFGFVDLTDSWVRPGDMRAEQLDILSQAAADAGVEFASLSAIRRSVIDKDLGREHLDYSHRTLAAAYQLGITVVSFGLHQALTTQQRNLLWFWRKPGHRDDPADWDLAVARFQELGDAAAELGILVSLEMYEHTFLGTAQSAVRLVQDIDRANVGLNPDIGNLIRLPEPIEHWRDLLAATLPYTNFWHVKNYARDEDPATGAIVALPTSMELGLINYREAMKMAIANGFQGVICVENYGGDGLSITATNRDYLHRIMPNRPEYPVGSSHVIQFVPEPVRR